MKKMLFFLIIASCFGCTKLGKNVTIKGKVLNPVTGLGIEGAEVKVLKTAGGFNGGFKAIKTVKSNSDGSFEISKLSLEHCYVVCHTPLDVDYHQIGWEIKTSVPLYDAFTISVKKGKTMHADYYAVAYGNIKKSIKNTSCFDQNDILVINRKYQLSNLTNSYTGSSTYNGCFEFIGNVYSQYPMGWHYMSGYYTKNNITTNFSDSIYIDSGGYHEWIFEY